MTMLRGVVDRAIKPGEARPEAANGHVFDAITAMMTYRSRMCGCEWRDREVEETVDQLTVPPLRPNGA
ncbi:TetR/AcrR family transcriptional regulator C-terminal ligand-binding domain-containing protein [Streptomyces hawaiiensis]|uniref:TetR/AcrR family transcriptional regulator C-terminal ligand-binding domain-containing protein n=1 Tax=Streptomyces hawaiiensis TaxID=67305 RepID=UPI00365779C2